jgi:formyltetrahydrofolate-dependent phosphoribosylglycinamide formyltransferase
MRLVVMISGSGTNLQAIIDATKERKIDATIEVVVSNKKNAYGLVRAEQTGIPTLYFPLKPYLDRGDSREQYDADLAERIRPYQPDLIVLSGWMLVLSPAFLDRFPRKVINLHPALPGAFPGTEGIQRTFDAYQRGEVEHGGCMIHWVVPEIDAGDVIVQRIVPIQPDDTAEAFETRMHEAEHTIIVEAIAKYIERHST